MKSIYEHVTQANAHERVLRHHHHHHHVSSLVHHDKSHANRGNKRKRAGPPSISEQMHEVAREDVSPGHAPILIKQFTAPPPIFWRSSYSDDIVGLKIELFRYRRRVVIKRAHFITTIVISIYISLTSHQETHRRKARPVHLPYIDALGAPKRAAAAAA